MPPSKQTAELTFGLQALIYRIRQLIKERRGYSKTKARELAKLLRESRDDFARVKTEDIIANDDLIAALEIIELHCEQLLVRANMLDHLAFGQKRKSRTMRRGKSDSSTANKDGSASGLWRILGFGKDARKQRPGEDDAAGIGGRPASNAGRSSERLEVVRSSDSAPGGTVTPPDAGPPDCYIEPELDRAAAVIFFSYPRLPRDIQGLPELRAKLVQRWGTEFAARAQEENNPPVELPQELVDALRVQKAPAGLVEKYLKEIARSHGISWQQDSENGDDEHSPSEDNNNNNKSNNNNSGGSIGHTKKRHESSADGSTPLRHTQSEVAPATTPSETFKDSEASPGVISQSYPPAAPTGESLERSKTGIPQVDELARRFAALKR
ncbi:Vacuolar protein sorting-associated protein ist1 [Ophidiomyces ophidiicola]|nr:Vacuolar protein sorting-associated protein ist1 [Ophidiomyces ophidiicola]